MAARTFRKATTQNRFFFAVIFYVYTNVDNRKVIENKGARDEHGNSKRR